MFCFLGWWKVYQNDKDLVSQVSKSASGQMSLSPTLSCYNTDQEFRWKLLSSSSEPTVCPIPSYLGTFHFGFPSIRQGLRGDHWVLYNYIKAEKQFQVFFISLLLCTSYFQFYCSITVIRLGDILPWDVLPWVTFCPETFCPETFCPDIFRPTPTSSDF